MKIKLIQITILLLFFILTGAYGQNHQKTYWKVIFPGFQPDEYNAQIDVNGNLNLSLNKDSTGSVNKFVSIDKSGQTIFSKEVNDIALQHIVDGNNNHYLIAFNYPDLKIEKQDAQTNILWHQTYFFSNPIDTSNFPFFGHSGLTQPTKSILLSNGNLVVAGLFEKDAQTSDSHIMVLIIDPLNGTLLSTRVDLTRSGFIDLQEDNNGNINIIKSSHFSQLTIDKISPNGILISSNELLSIMDFSEVYLAKTIGNVICLAYKHDFDPDVTLLKLDKTTLDTILLTHFSPSTLPEEVFYDATDSLFYMKDAFNSSNSNFQIIDNSGNVVCLNNSVPNFLYPLRCRVVGEKFYVFDGTAGVSNNSCAFDTCSAVFDSSTYWLLGWTPTSISFGNQRDNYSNEDVMYFAGMQLTTYQFGIVAVIDAEQNDYSGRLYYDINNNCVQDIGEPGLANQLIKANPGGKLTFTNKDGYFENYLDDGSYNLRVIPFSPTSVSCPSFLVLNIADTSLMYGNNNFGLQDQSANLQDFFITINQTTAVPGQSAKTYLTIGNKGPVAASGVIKLTMYPGLFSFVSASITPDSINGDFYYWHVNNLNGFTQQLKIAVEFSINSAAVINDMFDLKAEITNVQSELNLSDNIDYFSGVILGSYDPNDKNVYPRGIGTNGEISANDSVLKYKIQFQNTGNYQAFTIKVIDTIDTDLDLSTFQFLSSSHNCQVSFLAANVLQFTFNDINLPDSTSNEALSHGFINYSIHLKQNLLLFTQIKNKAAIYFDFNEPVITNETVNTIDAVGIKELDKNNLIKIYPNPAEDFIKISVQSNHQSLNISVVDLQGRVIQAENIFNNDSIIDLKLNNFKAGYYFLKVENEHFSFSKGFVKK